jgi:hypothetical protein
MAGPSQLNLEGDDKPKAQILRVIPERGSYRVGEEITFVGRGESSEGNITQWKWTLGDNITIRGGTDIYGHIAPRPIMEFNSTYIFQYPCVCKVKLEVKDDKGRWSDPDSYGPIIIEKGRVELLLSIKPGQVNATSENVTITVSLGNLFPNNEVKLQIKGPGGYNLTRSVWTRESGDVSFIWSPPAPGMYKIVAHWEGDASYETADASGTVEVFGQRSEEMLPAMFVQSPNWALIVALLLIIALLSLLRYRSRLHSLSRHTRSSSQPDRNQLFRGEV